MSNTVCSIDDAFLAVQSLAPAEKLELISRLWDNIRLGGGFRPSDRDLAEIQGRSAELDAGEVKAVPWESVCDSVRTRLTSHD